MLIPYLSQIFACSSWTIATLLWANIGSNVPVGQLNLHKAVISFILFFITWVIFDGYFPETSTIFFLILSGIIGFGIADYFSFYAFKNIGSARTLIILAFGPSIIGVFAYFFLNESLSLHKWLALILLFVSIIFLSLDKSELLNKKFTLKGVLFAVLGIILDSFGVVLTKKAFLSDSNLSPTSANIIRIGCGILIVILINLTFKVRMVNLSFDQRKKIFLASFLGTFVSLYLYLYAISKAHPAVIAGIGSLAPLMSSIYEHHKDKKLPSFKFILSILVMIAGIILIII